MIDKGKEVVPGPGPQKKGADTKGHLEGRRSSHLTLQEEELSNRGARNGPESASIACKRSSPTRRGGDRSFRLQWGTDLYTDREDGIPGKDYSPAERTKRTRSRKNRRQPDLSQLKKEELM